jgi:hypothetical protein
MKQFIRIIKIALGFSWRKRFWLFLMYPLSGLIRLMVLTVPFKYLSRFLGQHHRNHQLCVLVSDTQLQLAREIGGTIALLDKYTPWKSNCMVEGILARIWLAAYGIPYVFYMGAYLTKDAAEPMKAHAWVGVGPKLIVGGHGHQRYAIVGTFVSRMLADSLKGSRSS